MLFTHSLFSLIFITSVSATARQYNTYQISNGVGGQAQAEAIAAFPGALSSLTGTSLSDVNVSTFPDLNIQFLTFKQTEAHCAVLAEASFISAQTAAGANTAAGKALAVGMIKNKVLKIYSMHNIPA